MRAVIDIDPEKIGGWQHGLPILSPASIPEIWKSQQALALLVAVGARSAHSLIRSQLREYQLEEGRDWWFVA